jgi:hypothetical protein
MNQHVQMVQFDAERFQNVGSTSKRARVAWRASSKNGPGGSDPPGR